MFNTMFDMLTPAITGHIKIIDYDTQEILLQKNNQINFEAMSQALALSLANRPNGPINLMVFGNGASSVSATGVITYLAPNVTGLGTSTLYHQTYRKFVNDQTPHDIDAKNNFISVNHITNTTYSDVVVTCLLDYGEPEGQQAFDNEITTNGTFIFDELGLATYNASTASSQLLTHVIFHPVQKALNRRVQIVYTLRLAMS